jgi:hypothetical protein
MSFAPSGNTAQLCLSCQQPHDDADKDFCQLMLF